MAKRVNKPAVAALTIGLMVVLIAVGVLLVKAIPSKDVTPMVKSAEQAMANHDYTSAVKLYQTAYSRSQDSQWLVEAGKAAREQGEAGAAFAMWQTAILKDPNDIAARQNYVSLYIDMLELSDWRAPGATATTVYQYADALLATQPDNFDGLFARGISSLALRTDKPELEAKGVDDLQKALTARPDDERVLAVLGQYYIDVKKTAQAQKLFEDLIQREKDNPTGYLMLGKFLLGQKKIDQAIAPLTKAVELSTKGSKALVALSQAYQARKDYAKADEMLVKAIQVDPDEFDPYFGRSVLLQVMGKPADALKVAKEWLEKPALYEGFRANRYRSNRIRMQLQAATTSLAMAAPSSPGQKPDEEMLKQAEVYLDSTEKDIGKDSPMTLMIRADVHRLRGQNIQAIKLLERADTAFSGGNPDVKVRLAELYRQDGNLGAAQKALASLSQLVPDYGRGYYLQAMIAIQIGNRTEALALLDKGLSLEPDDKSMLELKMVILKTLGGRDAEVQRIQKKIGNVDPAGGVLGDKMQMAHRKLLDERPEEAVAIYKEILANDPANMTALRPALQVLVQLGKTDDARALLNKAKETGDDARLREMEFLLVQGLSPEQRDQKVLELINSEPDPQLKATQLYVFHVSRRNYDEAQKATDALEAAEPGSERVIRMQFALALARQDWDRANRYLLVAQEKDLDGAEGGFMRAQMAMRQGDWTKAQAELEKALTRYPTHPTGWVWLGETFINLKEYDRARDVLIKKALEINPNKGEAFKDLAIIADIQADQGAYRTNLAKALQYMPNDPWVVERTVYQREQDDPDKAIEARRKRLADAPDDMQNALRLAQLLEGQAQGKGPNDPLNKAAADLLNKALAADAQNLQLVWNVANFYQRQNDPQHAEKIMLDFEQAAKGEDKAAANGLLSDLYAQQNKLDKAEQSLLVAAKISAKPQANMALAQFYRRTGRIDDATKAFRQAIEAAASDSKIQASLRQSLIEMLLQSQKLADAATEIDAYHAALPDDATYLLMRGTLLMLQGKTNDALTALTEFLQKDRANAIGLYRRGLLYLAMSKTPQAIEDLQAAKAASPDGFNFEHRIALAGAFEASKQPDRAVLELKDILQNYPVQSHPQSMNVAKALATLYVRMDRPQDFEALADSIIAQVPDDLTWPVELGRYGESTGNLAKAVKGYSAAARASESRPDMVDNLLRVMISGKQYDQVIDYVNKQLPENMRGGPIRARLAQAYYLKGQQDKARELYKQALVEARQNFTASSLVVRNIAQTLSAQAAIDMLREQLAANPGDVPTQFMLIGTLSDSQKYDEAISLNGELLATAKTDDDKRVVLRQRGSILYQAGRFAEAAKAYEDLLALSPEDPESLNNVAYIYAENLNRPAEGLPYARRAVALNPRSADMLDTLGWVQYLAGDLDGAVGSLVSALQISANNVPAHYHIGMVYKKKGDAAQANREFGAAMNLIKSNAQDPMAKMFEPLVAKELTESAGSADSAAGK